VFVAGFIPDTRRSARDFATSRTAMGSGPYRIAVTKGLLIPAKRAARCSSFLPAVVQIDRLDAATCAKSSWFKTAAVTRNPESRSEQMHRRCRASLPQDHLMVEQRPPALRAASSEEVRS
jgi:hypothetical protein